MASAQSPNTANIYSPVSPAKEVNQYQAFVVSIPVAYCIMVFVFIYFFLKKQDSASPSPPPLPLPPTLAETPSFSFLIPVTPLSPLYLVRHVDLKEDLIDKLPTIIFDEELKARDSSCCVCLGEFELKEELIQAPSCKHIFHSDCIRNWLISNTTCPLCRCSVIVIDNAQLVRPPPPPQTSPAVTSVQLAATS